MLVGCGGGSSASAGGTGGSPSGPTGSGGSTDGGGSTPATDASLDVAEPGGWASQEGGTRGGADAAASAIYTVATAPALQAALSAAGSAPKIIKVAGTIDMTAADNGGPFTSESDQSTRSRITLNSNTTLIGLGADAKLFNATVLIKNVSNVIVRNLTIVNPCDIAPIWEPDVAPAGKWNARYDGITVAASTHVWIDHNHFTDAPVTEDLAPIENGLSKQCHDGAVDITHGSDYVTVSYNVFEQHDKNTLVGSAASTDAGLLSVTFHHNWFSAITQRTPRVRYGHVHVYSNYYEGDTHAAVYRYGYSLGVGYQAQILSEANVFEVAGASTCADVVSDVDTPGGTGAITDTGSLLNGASLALATDCAFAAATWSIPYTYTATAATQVKSVVTGNAGVGRLSVK